jgi:hypothetical protein
MYTVGHSHGGWFVADERNRKVIVGIPSEDEARTRALIRSHEDEPTIVWLYSARQVEIPLRYVSRFCGVDKAGNWIIVDDVNITTNTSELVALTPCCHARAAGRSCAQCGGDVGWYYTSTHPEVDDAYMDLEY